MIVPGTSLLRALKIKPSASSDHEVLHTTAELQEVFSYYFAKGAAVERPYSDALTYQSIVATASTLDKAQVITKTGSYD